MRRERLIHNLKLLYPLDDWRQRQRVVHKKRKRNLAAVLAAVLTVSVLCLCTDTVQKELTVDKRILRNRYEEGAGTVKLTARVEGKKYEVELQVEPESYTQEELEELFYDMLPQLEENLLGENSSPQEIRQPLHYTGQIAGYPFTLRYESSSEAIRADGSPESDLLTEEGESLWITVTAALETFQRIYRIPLRVYPPRYDAEQLQSIALKQAAGRAESRDREKESFALPDHLGDKPVQWEETANHQSLLLLLSGLAVLPWVWSAGEREVSREVEKRKRQLLLMYPEFVTRLTLLLGTGITVRSAFERIMQEEERRTKEENRKQSRQQNRKQNRNNKGRARDKPVPANYLLTELKVFSRSLDAGTSESQAYQDFGNRCGLQQYRRVTALLVQNLRRGSKSLLTQLEYETHNALEEKMAQARQWSAEADSRLLIPMTLLLSVVMVLVIVPAFGSFSL